MQNEMQEQRIPKPVTVRIDEFKEDLNRVVAESQLPPFLLEMLIGEYLTGVSQVAQKEYAQDRADWEKAGDLDGRYKQGD